MAKSGSKSFPFVCEMLPASRAEAKTQGDKFYFTGKSCKHGHLTARVTAEARCYECKRIDSSEQQKKNPERYLAASRRWSARNRELETKRFNKYKENNKEYFSNYWREYGIRNREKIKERQRLVRAERPELHKAADSRRRSRKLQAEGAHTARDILEIRKSQKNKCAACRIRLKQNQGHIDHIIALARGGTNWPKNLQLLCRACNLRKSARDPLDFMRSLGRLC